MPRRSRRVVLELSTSDQHRTLADLTPDERATFAAASKEVARLLPAFIREIERRVLDSVKEIPLGQIPSVIADGLAKQQDRRRGALRKAQKLRDAREALCVTIEGLKVKHELSERAAVRRYLREEHSKSWHTWTDKEKTRKVDNLTRQLRDARKKNRG